MAYTFLVDPEKVKDFAGRVLGNSSKVVAFASVRKKYHPNRKLPSKMTSGSSFYRHETSGGDLLRTIHRMSGPEGMYPLDNGTPAELDWMALYVTVNGRDAVKAAKSYTLEVTKSMFETGKYTVKHLTSKVIGHLMKPENAIQRWTTIDIDDVEKNYTLIKSLLDKYSLVPAYTVTTRGGYHLLFDMYDMSRDNKRDLFKYVREECPETIETDMPCPIPGTLQGGKEVIFCSGFPI